MRILQIAPEIAPGSGVGGVAHHLEAAWRRAGHETARFTMTEAGGDWLPRPGAGLRGKVALLARVVWFTVVGTIRARPTRIASHPERAPQVTVCHNDVLAGEVYVNHGILRAAMRERGGYWWRMARNPLHAFTTARDTIRYTSRVHRAVVNLTDTEDRRLREIYPRLQPRTTVIANGVDTDRFAPATPEERDRARRSHGIAPGALHVVFIGHEFERKGLPLLLRAAANLPEVQVSVVGGTTRMVAHARARLGDHEVAGRVRFAGQVDDPRPWLVAADALVLPSAYEANALVLLEAMACGLPVISTPVGYAPQIVTDGVTGYLTDRSAQGIHSALVRLAATTSAERARMSSAARRTGTDHDWDTVARRYVDLFTELTQEGPR